MKYLYGLQPPSLRIKLLLLSGGLLITCNAPSQSLYNETSIFVNGAAMFVDGDVLNNGLIVNEGHIGLSSDWESEGRYEGKGAIEVRGNGSQRIIHHNQSLAMLVVNGWGPKYIKGQINITDRLLLNSGIVHVSGRDVLKLHKDAEVEGGSADSYVEGAITVKGAGYRFFPLGKNGTYAPIEFLDVKGKSPEYSVEVFENTHVISLENVIVRNGVYWQRRDLAGDFRGSSIAVEYDPWEFRDVRNMIMLTGVDWQSPFTTIADVEHSAEMHKLITRNDVTDELIMLGEFSPEWRESDFYFSTALSPNAVNADNRNVRIFGDRLLEEEFRFVVFSRWGDIVYENNSLEQMLTNGWDGRTTGGEQLAAGTYPYRLTAIDKTGNKIEKNGVVTIIY